MKTLHTERLNLRPFNLDDAPFILSLVNTPGWLQYIGDRKVYSLEDAENYLKNGALKNYQTQGFGFLLVELTDSKKAIGMCGLVKRETLADVDIGYALLPEFEGRGYAYEAAMAILTFAKQELQLKRIVAITNKANIRSANLLKKIGLVYEGTVCLGEDEEELFLFATPNNIN